MGRAFLRFVAGGVVTYATTLTVMGFWLGLVGIPELTAYALTPEALETSIKLGAVSFLPKEKMTELEEFVADVVLGGNQPVWGKLFGKLGHLFDRRFGHDWKEQNQFFKEFEIIVKRERH